jgi:hypothetical protein
MYTDLEKKSVKKIHPGGILTSALKTGSPVWSLNYEPRLLQRNSRRLSPPHPPSSYLHSLSNGKLHAWWFAAIQLQIFAANGNRRYTWRWIDCVGKHVQYHEQNTADCSPEEQGSCDNWSLYDKVTRNSTVKCTTQRSTLTIPDIDLPSDIHAAAMFAILKAQWISHT